MNEAKELPDLGDIVADMVHRCSVERMTGWETVLRLHVKPKPAWMPESLWVSLLNLVLVQSHERRPSND